MRILSTLSLIAIMLSASLNVIAQKPLTSILDQINESNDSSTYILNLKKSFEEKVEAYDNSDSLRFELLFALHTYYDHNYLLDSSYSYITQAKKLLDTNSVRTSLFYEALAVTYFQQSEFDVSLAVYDSAISFAKRDSLFDLLPGMYSRKSVVHNTLRDRIGELATLKEAISLADSLESYEDKASAAINLGVALFESKLYDDAKYQFNDVLTMVKQIEDEYTKRLLKTYAFANLANIYSDLHQIDTSIILLDSADKYVDKQQHKRKQSE